MANWDIKALQARPRYSFLAEEGGIKAVLYEGEPYQGKPTQVFAYVGIPETAGSSVPGIVLVHGGGGTAFREWVQLWVERGYAAISMDLSGRGPDGQRLLNGGPEQGENEKFDLTSGWQESWTYHSVAAIMRAHSLLRAERNVDRMHIAVTGISWGGYLTCIVAGVDQRFACAIPVYGCGFLQDNSAEAWMKAFKRMTRMQREEWHELCDPASYLPGAAMPMLFVTGTNDSAYPLDSLKKSYSVVPGPAALCVRREMPHSHTDGWAPVEIHLFTDHLFRKGPALPLVSRATCVRGVARAGFCSERPFRAAYLLHTSDTGAWVTRKWHSSPAKKSHIRVIAPISDGTTACFLAVEDDRGAYASSPYEEVS